MPKRNGFFKRVGEPVILTVGRSNQLVKTGDVILADFDSMMDKHGWQFQPKFNPSKERMEIQQSSVNSKTQAAQPRQSQLLQSQLLQISGFERREMTTSPRSKTASESMIDSRYAELVENNTIKLGALTELDERAHKKTPIQEIEVNFEPLKRLKKFKQKEWFSLSKEEAKEILDAARIDYSHVLSEKWELIKFIKSLIKDIE